MVSLVELDLLGAKRVRQHGALIVGLVAPLWALSGLTVDVPPAVPRVPVLLASLIFTIVATLLAIRSKGAVSNPRSLHVPADWMSRYNRIGLLQALGIAASVVCLVRFGRATFITPAVCLVVGLHFVPLAKLLDQSQYLWAGIALCVVAVAGVLVGLTAGGAWTGVVVGLGAAMSLWATSIDISQRG